MEQQNEPILNLEALGAMTPAERNAALEAYTAAVAAKASADAGAQYANELAAARYAAAKYRMASEGGLEGFAARLPDIEKILADTPALAALSDEEKLRTAYYIDRGMQPREAASAETLVAAVKGNAEAMRLLEAAVLEKLRAADVPPLSATAGNASVPVTPQKKPKSIDEASALARAAFGI